MKRSALVFWCALLQHPPNLYRPRRGKVHAPAQITLFVCSYQIVIWPAKWIGHTAYPFAADLAAVVSSVRCMSKCISNANVFGRITQKTRLLVRTGPSTCVQVAVCLHQFACPNLTYLSVWKALEVICVVANWFAFAHTTPHCRLRLSSKYIWEFSIV